MATPTAAQEAIARSLDPALADGAAKQGRALADELQRALDAVRISYPALATDSDAVAAGDYDRVVATLAMHRLALSQDGAGRMGAGPTTSQTTGGGASRTTTRTAVSRGPLGETRFGREHFDLLASYGYTGGGYSLS